MQSPASCKSSGCTHLKPQSGSPKIGMQGRSLSQKSRNLVYFDKLVAGREGFSFSNQNNKQRNCWARRHLKVTQRLMARLSSKCVLRLASLNVKPQNSPGLCAEPNVYAEIAQAHPSAVQSLGPPSCPVDDSDQVCSSSASPACEGEFCRGGLEGAMLPWKGHASSCPA